MSTVKPTDKVLVQRGTTVYSAPADMSTVQDTDLLLINRSNTDYKCTYKDWKASQSKAPVIGGATLADSPEAGRFTSGTFATTVTMTENGIPTSTKKLKAYVEGTMTLTVTPTTDKISNVAGNVLTFATAKDLNYFAANNVVQVITAAGANTKAFRYWRLQIESFTDAHDPTSAYRFLLMEDGTEFELERSHPNNCSDQGTNMMSYIPPTLGSSTLAPGVTYGGASGTGAGKLPKYLMVDFGTPKVVLSAGGYNVYSAAARGAMASLSGSDDQALWTEIARAEIKSDLACGKYYIGGNTPPVIVKVVSVNAGAKQITVSAGGKWKATDGTGDQAAGQDHLHLSTRTITLANVKRFCKLNAAGAVSDLQSADPGFTAWTPAGTGPYTGTVTFPATLPTGHAPDVDLPEGTALTVEVQATNTSGTDTSRSNTVTPI